MSFIATKDVINIAKSVSNVERMKEEYPDETWWSYEWNKAMASKPATKTLPKKLTLADICE